MHYIAYRRKELNLSQAMLAKLCGVSRQCISDIESGQYLATPELAAALTAHLKTTGISSSQQVLSFKQIHRLVTPKPFDLPAINREPWQRMHRTYWRELARLKLPPERLNWMERNLPLDSAVEGFCNCSLAAVGAEQAWCSPHDYGYRQHCLLDSLGFALGERLLPALRWVTSDFESIFWPQPRLLSGHGSFRPDGLWLVKNFVGAFWEAFEVDGPFHRLSERSEWDKEREEKLGLDFIRISSERVLRGEAPEFLSATFRTLGQRRAA